MDEGRVKRRLAAILVADVAGYSRLMGEDEAGTRARFNSHINELVQPAITGGGGRIVKMIGDGLLVEFASVVDAVQCAAKIQKGMSQRNAGEPKERRMEFRIGVNLGDVIIEGDDLHGDGVNIAARMEGLADPGGILISGAAFDQTRKIADVGYKFLGEHIVKNIANPIRVYQVLTKPDYAGRVIGQKGIPIASRKWLVIVATGTAILTAGVAWWQPWNTGERPASIEQMTFPLPKEASIAVLPFTDMSDDESRDYFANGLTEDLTTNLARFPHLFVIAHDSTMKFKGGEVEVRDVAHSLGIRYVLRGSVRRAGNSVRVNARLIDALNGKLIWARSYDRELNNIFALQDEIVGEIGSHLVSNVVAAEFRRHSRRGTGNSDAYDLFLRGWDLIQALSPTANAQAIKLFERAILKDPEFARAYAYLALTSGFNASLGWANGPNYTFEHAIELARKAVALDARDALTHRVLGHLYRMRGDYDHAIEVLERAMSISPSDPDTLIALAFPLAFLDRADEAVGYSERALRLNPDAPWHYWYLAGVVYYIDRQFDKAISAFERSHQLNSRYNGNNHWLAASYAQFGRTQDAAAARRETLSRQPQFTVRSVLQELQPNGVVRQLILEGYQKAGFPS